MLILPHSKKHTSKKKEKGHKLLPMSVSINDMVARDTLVNNYEEKLSPQYIQLLKK